MNTVKKILIYTVLVGTISIALTFLFNDQNISTLITRESINGTALTWYKFNWIGYKDNLITEINRATKFALPIPTRSWTTNILSTVNSLI